VAAIVAFPSEKTARGIDTPARHGALFCRAAMQQANTYEKSKPVKSGRPAKKAPHTLCQDLTYAQKRVVGMRLQRLMQSA
jgi:hypothetical protein